MKDSPFPLVALSECLREPLQTGFACGTNNRTGLGVPHLRPMNVSPDGTVTLVDLKFVPADKVSGPSGMLELGDVLFNNTNSPELVGKTALYDLQEPRAFSNHMTRVRTRVEALDPRYCAYALHQKWREGYFESICNNHVSQASVSREKLAATEIPLPPIEQQRRIAAKLDDLLGRVAATRERLDRVPGILRRFRQSVLAAAFSGRLTEEWRAAHAEEESAAELVLRCDSSTRDRASAAVLRRKTAGLPVIEWPYVLPSTWCLKTIRELLQAGLILDFQDGNHGSLYPRTSDFSDDGVPFLTASQIYEGVVHVDEAPRLRRAKVDQLRIGFTSPLDVLLTNNATVGRVAVLSSDAPPCVLGTSATYYRLRQNFLDPDFVAIAMEAPHWQEQLASIMEQTTRNQVSVTKQIELVLPVAPIAEQRELARRVKSLSALAAATAKRHRAAQSSTSTISESTLARAFGGGL